MAKSVSGAKHATLSEISALLERKKGCLNVFKAGSF